MADGPEGEERTVRAGRRRLAVAALALACVVASPLSTWAWSSRPGNATGSAVQPVAVFGTDDRVPLPAKYKDVQEKIGLLFNVRGRTVCTAFCVASDVIATAGHCLLGIAGERTPRDRRLLVRAQLRRRARLSPTLPATPTARPRCT